LRIVADWSSVIFGVRQQIQVKLLDQAFMGTNLQFAMLAYARVDFAATRPCSITTIEGLTLS
jgi:hypothetical protein